MIVRPLVRYYIVRKNEWCFHSLKMLNIVCMPFTCTRMKSEFESHEWFSWELYELVTLLLKWIMQRKVNLNPFRLSQYSNSLFDLNHYTNLNIEINKMNLPKMSSHALMEFLDPFHGPLLSIWQNRLLQWSLSQILATSRRMIDRWKIVQNQRLECSFPTYMSFK